MVDRRLLMPGRWRLPVCMLMNEGGPHAMAVCPVCFTLRPVFFTLRFPPLLYCLFWFRCYLILHIFTVNSVVTSRHVANTGGPPPGLRRHAKEHSALPLKQPEAPSAQHL